jgi:hypothetical protein
MAHHLKIWPAYYARVANGTKTFEVRNNDRGFQMGDTVLLDEWCPEKKDYTRTTPQLEFTIGFVLYLDEKRVAFSLLKGEG